MQAHVATAAVLFSGWIVATFACIPILNFVLLQNKTMSGNKCEEVLLVLEDPAAYYSAWHQRKVASRNWRLMPMPEYAATVQRVRAHIEQMDVPPALVVAQKIALQKLMSVSLRSTREANIVYCPPYDAPFPYIPTLLALQGAVEFLEMVWRSRTYDGMAPLYHSDRYTHYSIYCFFDVEDVLFLPTTAVLHFADFLRVRSHKVHFIGVALAPVFSDRFVNGPLDFWMHDLTHCRRMIAHDIAYGDRQQEAICTQREMLHRVAASPLRAEFETILFELVHEAALPFLRDVLLAYARRPNGTREPFERIDTDRAAGLDGRIMHDGNIRSGTHATCGHQQHVLNIFWYDALNTPATVTNKIRHGFFDPVHAPDERVWSRANRAPHSIVEVFRAFYRDVLGTDDVGDAEESVLRPAGLTQVFQYPALDEREK